ncbi:UTP--glucose-1-phosphate uridylyltransferase [Candidatus Dependentiae bacterium]|nr:UTP--glucose-1-phosphate uridylyltransferase [Candidatus Dependentiae bacterium]
MTELFNEKLFEKLRAEYISGILDKKNNIISGNIKPPDKIIDKYPLINSEIYNYYNSEGELSIRNNELSVLIMNGGMATRFGTEVKGIVEVFHNKSFLQLKIENIKNISEKYGVKIYVFIMNSLFTDIPTRNHFEKNNYFGYDKKYVKFFNQYVFKRIKTEGSIISDKDNLYYGSGHGDFFYAFQEFVIPDIDKNIKYIFYSNVDNVGACVDTVILGYHKAKMKSVTVEVAKKNKGDKGGVPAIVDGIPQIVEGFKLPDNFDHDSIKEFNTASYIFSMNIFEKKINLPFYVVEKKIEKENVIQFERIAGDLTMFFDSNYIEINRKDRFIPVKTKEDMENIPECVKQKFY